MPGRNLMKAKMIILLFSLTILSACTAIKLTPEGQNIRILGSHDVVACKVIGKTTATVTDTVIGLKRKEHIIRKELETLARNAAADMGGDTIVAKGKLEGGKQLFKVYKCRER